MLLRQCRILVRFLGRNKNETGWKRRDEWQIQLRRVKKGEFVALQLFHGVAEPERFHGSAVAFDGQSRDCQRLFAHFSRQLSANGMPQEQTDILIVASDERRAEQIEELEHAALAEACRHVKRAE